MKFNNTTHVLVTGGTGFIGRLLIQELNSLGISTTTLTRNKKKSNSDGFAYWNPINHEIDEAKLLSITDVIHLAGKNVITTHWNAKGKEEILNSRINTANFLHQVFERNKLFIRSFISASATGYYSHNKDENYIYTEKSGSDLNKNYFLSEVCRKWELAANQFDNIAERVIQVRIGVVFGVNQSAYQKLIPPKWLPFAPILGSGNQYIPWVSKTDVVSIFIWCLNNNNIRGIVNATAPNPIRFKHLVKLEKIKRKGVLFNLFISSSLIRFILGEKSSILLNSAKVIPKILLKNKFDFKYKTARSFINSVQ